VWKTSRGGRVSVNVQPIADGDTCTGSTRARVDGRRRPERRPPLTSTAPLKDGQSFSNGTAFLVRAGDRYVLFNDLGELIVCKLSPKGYEELDGRR